jgi:chromosome partitioning protein
MIRAIAISLKKGGVGKTTTAVNLSACLHKAGKKVLLVDIDPQASATISCGIDITTLKHSIYNLFDDIKLNPTDVIIKTSFGMDILPSHPDLSKIDAGMTAKADYSKLKATSFKRRGVRPVDPKEPINKGEKTTLLQTSNTVNQ